MDLMKLNDDARMRELGMLGNYVDGGTLPLLEKILEDKKRKTRSFFRNSGQHEAKMKGECKFL